MAAICRAARVIELVRTLRQKLRAWGRESAAARTKVSLRRPCDSGLVEGSRHLLVPGRAVQEERVRRPLDVTHRLLDRFFALAVRGPVDDDAAVGCAWRGRLDIRSPAIAVHARVHSGEGNRRRLRRCDGRRGARGRRIGWAGVGAGDGGKEDAGEAWPAPTGRCAGAVHRRSRRRRAHESVCARGRAGALARPFAVARRGVERRERRLEVGRCHAAVRGNSSHRWSCPLMQTTSARGDVRR